MSPSTSEAGRQAEERAAQFLRGRGYRIVCINYHWRGGEIDLIARDGNCLVFVEVKARSGSSYGLPEEAVTPVKQRKLIRTAQRYLTEHPSSLDLRFDVVALSAGEARLYQDAFPASE
jgi:putative endonuclease